VKCFIWSTYLYGAENLETSESRSEILWKFWNVVLKKERDQLDRSWKKWRSVTWVKEERNILRRKKKGNANWICHILRRNWLLKHVTKQISFWRRNYFF